jgi:hypothetical protein
VIQQMPAQPPAATRKKTGVSDEREKKKKEGK